MKKTPRPVRVGIVGTGGMAAAHAQAYARIPECRVVACCDIDAAKARAFAAKHGIAATFPSLDALLGDGGVDAVSVVTPDAFHCPASLAILKAGKHVLCEKPLATSAADARRMARAAAKAGTIAMVNFTYRDFPAIHAVAEKVRSGALGELRHISGRYFQDWLCGDHWGPWDSTPAWLWRLSTAHGSKGVLGDIGVHLIDFASYPAGRVTAVDCRLKTFRKTPARVGKYVFDANDSALITATFESGAVGVLETTRWATGHHNGVSLELYGDEGAIRVDLAKSGTTFEMCRVRRRTVGEWQTVTAKPTPNNYRRFIRSILTGVPDQPDFARGAEIQAVLDACEASNATGRTVRLAK